MEPQPFVLDTPDAIRERHESFDVYRADGAGLLRPAVVFVHGGPRPPGVEWRPRDQPVFVGYGSNAAAMGFVGAVVEHHMASLTECAEAADEIAAGLEQVRNLPGVDPDRIALWFFSGSGLLAADWLRHPPSWLRCIALTYPVLQPSPNGESNRDSIPRVQFSARAVCRSCSLASGAIAQSFFRVSPLSSRQHAICVSRSSRYRTDDMDSTCSTTPTNRVMPSPVRWTGSSHE